MGNGTDLNRLDLADDSIFEILTEGKTHNFSLSPDGSTLAYTAYTGQQEVLVLQTIAGGDEKSVIPADTGEEFQTAVPPFCSLAK